MRVWQAIVIAEHELSDLMDELSPVVDVGAAKGRHVGWVAEWVLDGVLGELDLEFDSTPWSFYVPQRRMYVRWHGQYRGVGY